MAKEVCHYSLAPEVGTLHPSPSGDEDISPTALVSFFKSFPVELEPFGAAVRFREMFGPIEKLPALSLSAWVYKSDASMAKRCFLASSNSLCSISFKM
jgi:hypothetical protein